MVRQIEGLHLDRRDPLAGLVDRLMAAGRDRQASGRGGAAHSITIRSQDRTYAVRGAKNYGVALDDLIKMARSLLGEAGQP